MNGKKKRPDGRQTLWIIVHTALILVAAVGFLMVFRSVINKVFLRSYANGNYSEYPEKLLLPLELGDNYTVPYNLGNVAYLQEDYPRAVALFSAALRKNPPAEEKECSVRINLALAMLHTFPFDTLDRQDPEAVKAALEALYAARAVLTEHGCACEAADRWDGHSEEAEKLKRDIDDLIRELTAAPPPPAGGGGKPPQDGESRQEEQQQEQQESGSASQQQPDEGEGDEMQRQQSLNDQLRKQKQELESGSYGNDRSSSFQYVTNGESTGYGEGAPW